MQRACKIYGWSDSTESDNLLRTLGVTLYSPLNVCLVLYFRVRKKLKSQKNFKKEGTNFAYYYLNYWKYKFSKFIGKMITKIHMKKVTCLELFFRQQIYQFFNQIYQKLMEYNINTLIKNKITRSLIISIWWNWSKAR